MVMAIFPHHLLMDFAMPKWMLVMGQVMSYLNGLPVLVVTGYGALMIVYRSGIRWDMASGLLFLSMFGWAVGAIPAIVDGTIVINHVMHNTLWVPGHFHTYLLLGMMTMVFGFMYSLGRGRPRTAGWLDRASFWMFVVATLGFTMSFLYSGRASVPRRFAVHLPEWVPYDRVASVFAVLVIAAVSVFVLRFLFRLRAATQDAPATASLRGAVA
jgi:cytochrome c oxidase subunit 1